MSDYRSIDGLDGIAPVGAILTMGRKGDNRRGVVEKDRFHLVQPKAVNDIRPHIAAFNRFNIAKPEARQTVLGNLVFGRREESFQYSLRNFVAPGNRRHPNRRPFCVGDGKVATRWVGGLEDPDDFREIVCPHDRCEFRQSKPAACKPFMWLRFRIRWPPGQWEHLPRMLVQFESSAWNTTKRFVGLFDHIDSIFSDLGIAPVLFGLPIALTLTFQTRPTEKTRFPVVVPTLDGVDPIDWFTLQQKKLEMLRAREQITLAQTEDVEKPMLIHQAYEDLSMPGPQSKGEDDE